MRDKIRFHQLNSKDIEQFQNKPAWSEIKQLMHSHNKPRMD